MSRTVDARLAQLAAHNAVPGGDRLRCDLVERPGGSLLVAQEPHGGARHLPIQQFRGLPKAAHHQPDDDATRAPSAAHAPPVTTR